MSAFNKIRSTKGKYTAIKNSCPHQGAPLCEGRVEGMTVVKKNRELEYIRDGEILRCPWHGWEFDLLNGNSIFNPLKCRTKAYKVTIEKDPVETYPVTIENEYIFVHI
ncbi:Rieske (2Fe-2S) protein [Lysinibacillus sp. FSL H8-0500]|uniref:Rieske (2Fe-2S) protein n=1 Tax=Lysinibacillus sp. FSL H8-0500 TaxID=2921393 RepID=UPI003100EE26